MGVIIGWVGCIKKQGLRCVGRDCKSTANCDVPREHARERHAHRGIVRR